MFDYSLTGSMTCQLATAQPTTEVATIIQLLQTRRISSVPVLDPAGVPIGMVSRTDLIRLGLLSAGMGGAGPSLPLRARTARDVMTTKPVTVSSESSLRDAAKTMMKH